MSERFPMYKRHAAGLIQNLVSQWLLSMKGAEFPAEELLGHIFVAGGAVSSLLMGEEVNDIDVYLTDIEMAEKLTRYYLERMAKVADRYQQEYGEDPDEQNFVAWQARDAEVRTHPGRIQVMFPAGVPVSLDVDIEQWTLDYLSGGMEAEPWDPVFFTPNAITVKGESVNVQIVLRYIGPMKKILGMFDFEHCCVAWSQELMTKGEWLHLPLPALESMLAKRLIFRDTTEYPLSSLIRMGKYIQRGWTRPFASDIVKMAFMVHGLDLNDPVVLQDQLVGIDLVYFMEALQELSKRMKSDEKVDAPTLFEVLDKVFR